MPQEKQPTALTVCFLTELWERFGFTIVQTLIIFIFIQQFNLSSSRAGLLVGTFTGLIYITSIMAGYISDFFLGYFRAVLLGCFFCCIGYFIIATSLHLTPLLSGLAIICIGTGLIKTNVSGFLGLFYSENDNRRNAGYTIFYIGINIGPILAATFTTWLRESFHTGQGQSIYFLGIITSLLSALIFFIGYKYYKFQLSIRHVSFKSTCISVTILLITTAILLLILSYPTLATLFFVLASITCIISLVAVSYTDKNQLKKTIIFLLFLLIGTLFWCLYFQIFIAINLYNDIAIDKYFYGFHVTPILFSSFVSFSVIIWGLLVLKTWDRVSDTYKFSLGSIALFITFLLLWLSNHLAHEQQLASAGWIFSSYLCLSFSEICISPIGLALATKLAPSHRNGLFLGAWFVVLGVGGDLAGVLSKKLGLPQAHDSLPTIHQKYNTIFTDFLYISILMVIITIIATYFIKRIDKEQ